MRYDSPEEAYRAITEEDSKGIREKKGFWGDIGEGITEMPAQILGGAADAVNETSQTLDDLTDWGAKYLPFLKNDVDDWGQLPTTDEAETVTGSLARTATQFLTGFIPVAGSMRYLGITKGIQKVLTGSSKFRKALATAGPGMAAGGFTEGVAFDPYEDGLAEMVSEWGKQSDAPIAQYLENNPLASGVEDSELEARIKNAMEGMLLDTAFEPLARGIPKALKAFKKTHTPENIDAALKDIDKLPKEERERIIEMQEANKIDVKKFRENAPSDPEAFADAVAKGQVEHFADLAEHVRLETDLGRQELYDAFEKKADSLGVKDWGTVSRQATDMDMSLGELKKTRSDTKDLDARILKARRTSHMIEKGMRDLAKSGDSLKNMVAFRKLAALHYDVRMNVKGMKTEIGRALNAMKIHSDYHHGADMDDVLKQIVDSSGSEKEIKDLMFKFANADSKYISHAVSDMHEKPDFWGNVHSYWINSILSGLGTHTRNFVGNIVSPAFKSLELGISAANPATKTTFDEAFSFMRGMIEGFGEAVGFPIAKIYSNPEFKGSVWKTFRNNISMIDPSRTFLDTAKNIPTQTRMGKVSKYMGAAFNMPTRVMVTMDEFFKVASYRADLRMQAVRKSRDLPKHQREKFIEDFLNHPSVEAISEAAHEMRKDTFQNDLGKFGKKLQSLTNSRTAAGRAAKFIMPFVRTPTNLLKFVGHRTPILNKLSKQLQADIAAGGIRKEIAEAKTYSGVMMYGLGMMLAGSGLVTGSVDKEQDKSGRYVGKGRYKLKGPDGKWRDISTADPIGSFFCLMADLHQVMKDASHDELENIASTGIAAVTSMISEKSYLKGLGQAITALMGTGIGDNESRLEWWGANMTTTFMPFSSFVKSYNRAHIDSVMREAHGFVEQIKSDIPGVSKGLPPKRNPITGEPMEYGSSGPLGVMPFYSEEESDDPILQELARLEHVKNPPTRSMEGVELSPKEYDDFQKTITQAITDGQGRTLAQRLRDIVQTRYYQDLPERTTSHDERETKEKLIDEVMRDYRRAAKRKFLRQNPSVIEKIKKLERGERVI